MNKKYLGLLVIVLAINAYAYTFTTGTLLPSGNGTYSAWVPSTGTTHYTLVDESPCNGTTDYVSTTINGNRDSYSLSLASIPNGALITGVSITPCASKTSNSGTANLSVFYRLNGEDGADSALYALSGTKPVALSVSNYSGISVTKNASTTFEVGALLASGTTGARLSRIATTITYLTVPNTPGNPQATVSSTTNVILTWQDLSSDETGFSIERSTDGTSFSFLATTTASSTNYFDNGLSLGTYYYKVRSYNAAGYSGYPTTTPVVVIP